MGEIDKVKIFWGKAALIRFFFPNNGLFLLIKVKK